MTIIIISLFKKKDCDDCHSLEKRMMKFEGVYE